MSIYSREFVQIKNLRHIYFLIILVFQFHTFQLAGTLITLMLRKSPYALQNFEVFYEKDLEFRLIQGSSLNGSQQNSQESVGQTINNMIGLHLSEVSDNLAFKTQLLDLTNIPMISANSLQKRSALQQVGLDPSLLSAKNFNIPNNCCTYCYKHFDEVLSLKQKQKQAVNSNSIQDKHTKIDDYFQTKYQNNSSNQKIQQKPLQKTLQPLIQLQLSFKSSSKNAQTLTIPFRGGCFAQQIQKEQCQSDAPFVSCMECYRQVCFTCAKQCEQCDKIICPFPLCQTTSYQLYKEEIICTKCQLSHSIEDHNIRIHQISSYDESCAFE